MSRKLLTSSLVITVVLLICCNETNAYRPAVAARHDRVSCNDDINHQVGRDLKYCESVKTTTQLCMIANLPNDDGSGFSYAERSRPYRRDVFDSDEWVRVRNTARFSKNLLSIFQSGVVRQLLNEAIFIAGAATFLCLYNALLVAGYDDFNGIHHDPFGQGFYVFKLPSIFFTLTSPALSLLLGKW
jgi:hypothetical protein